MDKLDKTTIVGQYALAGQENYEEYLKAIGLNVAKRAAALKEETRISCQITGDEWEVEVRGNKYMAFKFCLDNQFNRVTGDGRHVTTLFTLDEVCDHFKLTQTERWGGTNETTIVHEVDGKDYTMTMTFGEITCVRHFKRE